MKKSIKRMQSSLLGLLNIRFLSNPKLLILLAAILATVNAQAYDFEVDGIYYNKLSATEVAVTYEYQDGWEYISSYSGGVNIPSSVEYNGKSYDVTTIANNAFSDCSSLTSVTIPNSVTSIGYMAFSGCTSLTSVTIPNSVTSIGPVAFNSTPMEKDESNWENGAFYISNCLVYAKSSIAGALTIRDNTRVIADMTFYECRNLTSVTIPNSVTVIGTSTFELCEGLTSVTIGNSVTSIDNNAFCGCSGLTSVNIPNSVTSIRSGAFGGCSGLTSVTIPPSVNSIGESAFSGCSGLTSVNIPNSVTSIGDYAFSYCSGLTSVDIPNSMTSIGAGAFSNCYSLKEFFVNNSDPSNITLKNNVFENSSVGTATLYVPVGSKSLYECAYQWCDFGFIKESQSDNDSGDYNLVDGQPYTGKYDCQGVDVTYKRNFTAVVWQPLYVPYNMSYDEWKDYGRVAELSCVHAYDDGRTTIEFISVTSGELLPNVPYVFLPNSTGEVTFTGTNKTIKAAPAENIKYIMCSSPRYTFKIYGNYQSISGSTLATYGDSQFNGAYVMTSDNKFKHCSASSDLSPYRFYITREKSVNGYWGAPARLKAPAVGEDEDDVIYFMVDGVVCGIADIITETGADGEIYDLLGREVKNPSNGIYIQNGKKIRVY